MILYVKTFLKWVPWEYVDNLKYGFSSFWYFCNQKLSDFLLKIIYFPQLREKKPEKYFAATRKHP